MSKLSKALDKAKLERNNFGFFEAADPESSHMDKLSKAYQKSQRLEEEISAQLHTKVQLAHHVDTELSPKYTQTQILQTDPNVLLSNRILTWPSKAAIHDSYNFMWTQMVKRSRDQGWKSIMISSAQPGEGKTLTAINLAVTIAKEVSQTSLLVGANFRTPKLCTYMGLDENRPGLSDYLVNGMHIPELLFSPSMDKFLILPSGKHASTHTHLLGSSKMKALVQELKERYPERYVLYDCPHVLDMPDSLVFSSYVDAVLLVVQAGKTKQREISNALQILEDRGVNILGLVLNKCQDQKTTS